MIFERVANGGCQSYLLGCPEAHCAVVIDPALAQHDYYLSLAVQHGLRISHIVETHTHADHFSAALPLARKLGVPVAMHALAPAPHADLRLEDGHTLIVGQIRLRVLHTPGHTADSMCLVGDGRVFTGDTLLFGGTGRTDLPSGDPEALFDSLFGKLAALDPDYSVHPAHDYKGGQESTIGAEFAANPRLQIRERDAFVAMMRSLDLAAPTHMTEALRTNMHGGKTVQQLLAEAAAAVPFMALEDLAAAAGRVNDLIVLDVREKDSFAGGHIVGARHLPRGQLELRVNEELPDPTARIVTVCDYGKVSTLAAATLREMGFVRACALDGGMKAWRERGFALET
jgi:glyoxylase-like metal-dependent hydrolase (beta-lactamase superfamily II)/rhodanese-related sulfurtransferase